MTSQLVNTDNYIRAETARMFDGMLVITGGVTGKFAHLRAPVPIDEQNVIRMNRDTIYSTALVDISEGATLFLPDVGDRYISVMVVNEDHFINRVITEPGTHHLTVDEYQTPFVNLAARIFADPDDANDLALANAIQDHITVESVSNKPYTHADYDGASLEETRRILNVLNEGLSDSAKTFGAREDVEPVRHMLGTANGWGGLPEYEAYYPRHTEPIPVGHYQITFRDVPVDAFWSISIYNSAGFFEGNPFDSFSINSVTGNADADGSVTIDLAPTDDGYRNHLYVMEGWNYAIRLYRPRPQVFDGSWPIPTPQKV